MGEGQGKVWDAEVSVGGEGGELDGQGMRDGVLDMWNVVIWSVALYSRRGGSCAGHLWRWDMSDRHCIFGCIIDLWSCYLRRQKLEYCKIYPLKILLNLLVWNNLT